jgi:hypothetical protein
VCVCVCVCMFVFVCLKRLLGHFLTLESYNRPSSFVNAALTTALSLTMFLGNLVVMVSSLLPRHLVALHRPIMSFERYGPSGMLFARGA